MHHVERRATTTNKFQSKRGYFEAKNPLKSTLLGGIIVQHQVQLVDELAVHVHVRLLLLQN